MKIYLRHDFNDTRYFVIDIPETYICSSNYMSEMFEMTKEGFENTLVMKVIKHNDLLIYKDQNDETSFDISFKSNGIPDEVYIDRFKEAFATQLTLLILGGENKW